MRTDVYGSEVAVSADAAPLWDDALVAMLRLEDDADERLELVRETDPGFCLGHALAAVLASDGRDAEKAAAALAAARASLDGASPRERSYLAAAEAHVRDGIWRAEPAWRRHNAEFPGDVVAVDPLLTCAYFGARDDAFDAADDVTARMRAAVGDVAPVRELLGWAAHERGRTDEAHAWAESLLVEDARWIGAAHVHAHAFYEANDHAAGARWIDAWSAAQDHQSYAWHLSWHSGLHHLALGDEADLLPRFLREMSVEPPRLSDGAMALWRYQLLGRWPAGADPSGVVAEAARARAQATEMLFSGWVAALGLASVGDAEALRGLAERGATLDWPGAAELLTPFAAALAAWVEGDAAACADLLTPIAPHLDRFGGSVAQVDLLHDTYVAALAAAGRAEQALAYADARDARRPVPVDRRLLRADLRPAPTRGGGTA